jgi:SAM-dependent methyltransferase
VDGIYQLTLDADSNLDRRRGATYIGYERVGAYFHGRDWAESACDAGTMALGAKMSELTAAGTLLDVGCGGGRYAVPAALHGCTVIGGDISNGMLRLLLRKAATNRVAPGRIVACRLNALSLPLPEASVDGATLNNVLHLVSEPERVISEVYRVLRPGGKLLTQVDVPTGDDRRNAGRNAEYDCREVEFHNRYWELLTERGIPLAPRNRSFNRHSTRLAAFEAVFGPGVRVDVPFSDRQVQSMTDAFLYRMGGKGFSAQQTVPDDIHEATFARVVEEFRIKYGRDFGDLTCEIVTLGLALHVFEK